MGGNALAEDQPGILGVVNKDIAVALDALDNVVTTHFVGVHRVLLHPVEQISGADQVGEIALAPADIAVQQNTGHIALDCVQGLKAGGVIVAANLAGVGGSGLVAAADLAEGQVIAGGIQLGIGGAQVVEVRAAVGGGEAAQALAPDVLTVPGRAAVPGAGIGLGGVEVHDLAGASGIGIGVFGIGLEICVAGLGGVGIGHQRFQAALQAGGRFR